MDKRQVADVLREMAMLLELMGENPFKVRAYENAARTVEGLSQDISYLIAEGRLTEIKGIGKNLADHIAEIVQTGKLKEHEKLRASIPQGVIEMLAIPGLGPKRVRFIWEEMKTKTVGELELLCKRHRLSIQPGFGEKMEEKILTGIESVKSFAGQSLFSDAYAAASAVLSEIRKWPEVIRSEVAGSIRRRKELIRDIDILVSTDHPDRVMERFVALPLVKDIVQEGHTKSEVRLASGIQCDLRAVSDEEYPFALYYFTGSKEHNVAVRTLAKKAGIKMNEYGMFREGSRKTLACRDEAQIFKTLGLASIEPELREDLGEIEAAAKGRLPRLLVAKDILGAMHCHTSYSDGSDPVEKMAMAAKSRGYSYIVIADHSKSSTIARGLKPPDVRRQMEEIDCINGKIRGIRIVRGIEVDILPDGSLDFDDGLLSSLDIVIAAVHSMFGMAKEEMTKRIIRAISNPHVDILAHPTGRLLLAREPYAVDLKAVIDAAAEFGKAIEINAHPQRLDLDWRWLRYAKEKGVKFAICPDAHSPASLDDTAFGVGIARKGWVEKGDVLNCLTADELIRHFKNS